MRNLTRKLSLASLVVLTAAFPSWAEDKVKPDASALSKAIDQEIEQRLRADNIKPSGLADDAEFLRRVSLDISGVIPGADKAAAFFDNKAPNKRAQLIEELLADPQYGRHFADVWTLLMFPRESGNRRLQPEPLTQWLEKEFNNNTPWNELVVELLTSTGAQDKNGAVTFFLANTSVDKLTDSTARLFLGVQLQCAQCHNHPFTGWTQAEYWGMAAFFTKVRPDNTAKAAKGGTSPGVNENGKGKARLPESAKIVPPKFLQGVQPNLDKNAPYRPILAEWLTTPRNPFFAKAMVNRVWGKFFGRGIVNPIDDMHEDNVASHPEMLHHLAEQFVASGYDVKLLIRGICNSRAYQRTSKPTAGNREDETLYSHMSMKSLTPEQLYDSLVKVVGEGGRRSDGPRKGAKGAGVGPRAAFTAFFRTDDNAEPTEYSSGIPQALRLMNAPQLNRGGALYERAVKLGTLEQVVDELYLGTVTRRPTPAERVNMTAYVAKQKDARQAYGDIFWALLNSSEFALNH